MMRWKGFPKGAYEAALEAAGYESDEPRLAAMEAEIERLSEPRVDLCELATAKLNRGQPVSPAEAAAFIGVHKKLFQRMRAKGWITPCLERGSLVRYSARDVLRLAEAPRKER